MRLLGISGTIVGSKTEIAVKKTLDNVNNFESEIETEFLNLKDYDLQFCDGRDPSNYEGDTKKVIDKICEADCFVIGTPVFQGSLTGALKNLLDLLPASALRHKVVGFIATGGTFQHYLVIENQLKPIAGYFRSYVAPSCVYLNDSHFSERKEIIDEDIIKRLDELAKELIFMQTKLKKEDIGLEVSN
ncbi:NADPH-dependent FMN reductase [Salipaludibacillus sp. CF4.18]|uniref:NADPH-dependent FMN reductase n=1 Tax=Salipaludibacillus sp. CF4.18 TaxID=3373081 RepID=UPI003EE68C08